MRIVLVTPAPSKSLSGNRATAKRWASILVGLGHQVELSEGYDDTSADLMIALHAWRSSSSISNFKRRYPDCPLIVALTGTDAYRFIHSHPEQTLASIQVADYLVGLHSLIANALPQKYHGKLRVIYQSAQAANACKLPRRQAKGAFRLLVAGHLRHEKDPFRPALAIRNLPAESQIQLSHFGKAHSNQWAREAKLEMSINSRYQWFEEVPQIELYDAFEQSQLMVLPSRMEGGANVISEAITAGLPIIASNIDGSVGLLGEDYPGYYPVEDENALRAVLLRAETDQEFYGALKSACEARQALFSLSNEVSQWRALIDEATKSAA